MACSATRCSSGSPSSTLRSIQFHVLLLLIGVLWHSVAANSASTIEASPAPSPCLEHSTQPSPRRCHSPATAPQLLCTQGAKASISVGLPKCRSAGAFIANDARCLGVEPNPSFKSHLKRTPVAPVALAIRCKERLRCNGAAFALSPDEGHAGAEYLCGGLPRASRASSLVMPGGAHVGGGYSTYSGEERLSSHEESASPGGLAPSTSSGIKRSSAPPAAKRGNDSPTVSLACDDRENAAFAAGQLLEKARLVQTTASGFFCILPLGFRVLKKIEAVCHQELAGTASPLSFPNIMPIHWLQNSDRVRAFGPSLYRVQDRRARQFFLPPTSEEAAAWLAASGIRSHRDLPQVFYQIGPKFRDEARPRAGCLRAREFVMLEVYSFHKDALCRETTYEKMDACFRRILTRVGAGPVWRVRADPGAMGGPCSHEYHVRSILGSDQAAPGPDLPDGSGIGANPRYAEGSQISTTLEVGHCFQLPETYCRAAGARFTDSRGALNMPLMNSYGLGVSRLLAHLALMHQDSKGLLFPPQVAPFCVAVLPQPAARWNDGRRTARLGQALFRILHKSAAEAGGPADVFFDDRQGLTLRQMQSHADLVGIPHQLIIKEDLLRAPGKARVLYISRVTGKADILPLRAALNRLKNTLFGVAMSSRR